VRQSLFRIGQAFGLKLYRVAASSPILSNRIGRRALAYAYLGYKRWFEASDIKALQEWVSPGSSVVDVGANIGFFTLPFAQWVGPRGHVIAIEPEAENFAILERRVAQLSGHSPIRLINGAAADTTGYAFLVVNPHHPGDHKLGESGSKIKSHTIDDLLRDHPTRPVSLIKIDVQGHEFKVLKGAVETIARWLPSIFIEIDDRAISDAGSSTSEIEEFLTNFGYEPFVYRGNWKAIGSLEADSSDRQRRGYADYLFRSAKKRPFKGVA
jgi:FkbM family methyltransferase